jgi:hypothetical protein
MKISVICHYKRYRKFYRQTVEDTLYVMMARAAAREAPESPGGMYPFYDGIEIRAASCVPKMNERRKRAGKAGTRPFDLISAKKRMDVLIMRLGVVYKRSGRY